MTRRTYKNGSNELEGVAISQYSAKLHERARCQYKSAQRDQIAIIITEKRQGTANIQKCHTDGQATVLQPKDMSLGIRKFSPLQEQLC